MRSTIEISKSSFLHNIKILKSFAAYCYIVVKANGYGHGINEIVSMLSEVQIEGIVVSHNEEALSIKNYNKKIIILAPRIDEIFVETIKLFSCLEIFAYSIEFLKELNCWTKEKKQKINIHLKIETGFNRFGINFNEIEDVIDIIQGNNYINLIGLATHYHDPYRFEDDKILEQQNKLELSLNKINKIFKNNSIIYINGASSGVIDCNKFNTIRCGSAAYGFWKSQAQKKRFLEKYQDKKFEEILSWKTIILQIKNVNKGENIGYGIETIADENKKIAIVPIGYSDGYSVLFSMQKNGFVLICGKKVPVIGKLSMNIFAVDITNFPEINLNDEVFIINKNYENFSIENLSQKIGISALQFTTLISPFIKRIII